MHAVNILQVSARSTYGNFSASRLINGQRDVGGWISGVGEWRDCHLELRLAEPGIPVALEVVNGFIEENKVGIRDDYYYHLRPQRIDLYLGSGEIPVPLELADDKAPQRLTIPPGPPVDSLRLVIRDVYRDSPDGTIRSFDVVGLRHLTVLTA